ncbi:hypothetical protein LUZ63_006889 [Rhynchospora breviuscula]|uniref:Uncharacterized protein n=1 Tax=Rhynchospora breviuscula TaxID=2022672 RepID=A0A9Q0CRE9_9POAL|nr:hypothetical protein LUZ63_006889 [Rhynchospora breviuscula]
MAPPTVRDILAFHKIDRAVYEKFIAHGMELAMARNAVALFMWLDQLGIDMISQIVQIINPTRIFKLINEVDSVLHCLRQEDGSSNYTEIPLMTSLARNSLDIRFFNFHKDVIVKGLAYILDGVGRIVFDDHMYELLHAYEADMAAARAGLSAGMPPVPLGLAVIYDPTAAVPSIEDARSMFITFSKGLPIRREEIMEHFTERWGDCIDRVMMERTPPGGTPMYGRIVFKSDTYISLVLNGERVVKYNINGRQLWARKYVPRVAVN